MKTILIRYPHGYFRGGVWENNYSPSLTTSDWQNNNYILEYVDKERLQQGDDDPPKREYPDSP